MSLSLSFFFWPHHKASGIIIPQSGIEPRLPAVEGWILNHWITREICSLQFECIHQLASSLYLGVLCKLHLLLLLSYSVVSDSFVTPWTIACQAPHSVGFIRQEYWSGLSFPSLENLPNPGIEPISAAWQVNSLPLSHLGSPWRLHYDATLVKPLAVGDWLNL